MISKLEKESFLELKRTGYKVLGYMKSLGKQKIFCVGRNKTGTTSLRQAMSDLGYTVGEQRSAERLIRDWGERKFTSLMKYCKTAEFFQDIPFSLPYTFQAVDMAFPGSKFILTVRDENAWYESMVNFHRKTDVHGEKALSLEALKEASYCYKGFAYDTKVLVYDLPGDDPYHRETLLEHYRYHNKMVKDYFKNRPEDLLVLNLAEEDAYQKFVDFLGVESPYDAFPWENKT
jgi:hypothetical protein